MPEAASAGTDGHRERLRAHLRLHGECGVRGVIGGGSAEGGAVERHMIGFQRVYKRRGIEFELGERLAPGSQFHIASSREQAIREAASSQGWINPASLHPCGLGKTMIEHLPYSRCNLAHTGASQQGARLRTKGVAGPDLEPDKTGETGGAGNT
jgi:hypothetical protein